MRLLVFGGTRHVGLHVVSQLRGRGHDVAVLDVADPSPDAEADETRFGAGIPTQLIDSPKDGAGTRLPAFERDVAGFDAVVFCGVEGFAEAAEPAPGPADLELEALVLERLVAEGAKAVVLMSSAAVYTGLGATLTIDETCDVKPVTTLAKHCVRLERILHGASAVSDVSHAILRCGIIAGGSGGLPAVGRSPKDVYMLPGLSVTDVRYPEVRIGFGDVPPGVAGTRVRDVLHVSDAASAHCAAAELLVREGPMGVVFNVGGGTAFDSRVALEAAEQIATLHLEGSPAGTEPPGMALDSGALTRATGWRATPDLAALAASELSLRRRRALAAYRLRTEIRAAHEFLGSVRSRAALRLFGVLIVRDTTGTFDPRDAWLEVAGQSHAPRYLARVRLPLRRGGLHLLPYVLRILREDAAGLGLQNPIRLLYVRGDGHWVRRMLRYSSVLRRKASHRRGRLMAMPEHDAVAYVRQAAKNLYYLTMRAPNHTDRIAVRARIRLAWLASLIAPRRSTLVYEKEGARYEESGSVLFEELVVRGHSDVFYILPADRVELVPEPYRDRIVPRFSLRHFYRFFCARTFIGTETVFSAAELRSSSRLIMNRISRHGYRLVFLQHGVMYMVALSSGQRSFFLAGGVFPPGTKIVVSSQREARHFIDQGGFAESDMYVCGLPKFDRACRADDADRVLIMPTWRPWEHNLIRVDPDAAPYTAMIRRMYDAVPDELKEKTIILPHPLVRDALERSDLADRMWAGDSYDEALRSCALLITDYSSIAYDAFYRGANVVFWWQEKEACMHHYGGHLMIDEETAFGPVCYETDALRQAVAESYGAPQTGEHVKRYSDIVEFHDGRNTERLIGMLERDGLI